jgi:hypothetical protein
MRQMAILRLASRLKACIMKVTVRSSCVVYLNWRQDASAAQISSVPAKGSTTEFLFSQNQPARPRRRGCLRVSCVLHLVFMSPVTDGSLNNTHIDADLKELSHVE